MTPITQGQAWWLAVWTGRLLLLGVVAFWWGVIVVPQLVSLAYPQWLPPSAIPWHLNPDLEGSAANAVSAAALSTVAFLAFVTAAISACRAVGWITVGGWALLASTAAFLAWEEVTDFHISRTRVFGDEMFGMANSQHLWPVLLSPLIVAFIAAMWIFVHKGLQARAVRAPLILGVTAWMLAVVNEAIYLALFSGRAETLGTMLEETLEFSGTLLIGLSAGIALWSVAVAQPRSHLFSGTRLFLPVVGSMSPWPYSAA